MGEQVRVNREVSTEVGNLTPGFTYTVPDYEARRLRRLGAVEGQAVEERPLTRSERAAQLVPDEDVEALARAGARASRMARGASATR